MKWRHGILLLALSGLPSLAQTGKSPLSERLSQPAYNELGEDQKLNPVFTGKPDLQEWKVKHRVQLRRRWEQLLGKPAFETEDYAKKAEVLETFEQPEFRGTLLRQPTGPGSGQLVLLMEPRKIKLSPRPGAVVPFYHPDAMAGLELKTKKRITSKVETQFARHLVQQGYVVVCTEAFPYNTVKEPSDTKGLNWWRVAAERLHRDHPNWTGMGKLMHDTRRGIDLLLEQPEIDRERVLLVGHSLGGKMAFYTGCLDDRVKATIATDFGIGWNFTNWKDSWYLGDKILKKDFDLAHHQLLALHAPRPFLLVAGKYDKPESWQYLNAAKPAYEMYGKEHAHALGMIDHGSGHQPTKESMEMAYRWLAERFGLKAQDWEF